MIKVKNILLILLWISLPAFMYFVQVNGLISAADWSLPMLKLKNLFFYGIWPVIPLIFVSKPKFHFVHDPNKKWRNEVPVINNYRFFGLFGIFTLMALSLALYFFRPDALILPSELLLGVFLTLGIFIYRSQLSNNILQQFFNFSSELDYDYNDLYLQMKKMEKDSHHAPQHQPSTVANGNTHT